MDKITLYITIILFAIIFLVAFLFGLLLARIKRQTKKALSDIEKELRIKIAIAMGVLAELMRYAKYEKDLISEIMDAKKKAEAAKTEEEKKQAGNLLSVILKSVFRVSEKYPDLKLSQRFLALKQQLDDLEGGVEAAKDLYKRCSVVLKKIARRIPFLANFLERDSVYDIENEEMYERTEVAGKKRKNSFVKIKIKPAESRNKKGNKT
ncbi:MAG: LemA family protein [Candidatus Pacebacteria bacterium]|nr:LemA family protein [Candidatus Paceibacterota bacterium]